MDLLNPSRPRTLDRHNGALSREQIFVLQLLHRDPSRVVHKPAYVEVESVLVDLGDPTVVTHEVVFIARDGCFYQSVL